MSHAVDDLWSVAGKLPHVDAQALASAVEAAAQTSEHLDYRTRLLIRDSLDALSKHWGELRLNSWLSNCPYADAIERARDPDRFDKDPQEIAFPSLARRVVDVTEVETVLEFFRVLAGHVQQPTRLDVGGSIALMLAGLLSRRTDDIDVVNEVPAELRNQHQLLDDLTKRFKLNLAHFQSHYRPLGWQRRLRLFESFEQFQVYLVDPYDVMVSKVCSKRDKDLDDLRAMKGQIDRDKLKTRLFDSGRNLLAEDRLFHAADGNWYVLYGEHLSRPT